MIRIVILFVILLLNVGCSSIMPTKNLVPSQTFNFSDNVQINYQTVGNGESPIILLHGFGASILSWDDIKDKFPKKYKLYLIDLKGFGFSSKPDDDKYSIADQADVINKFIEYFQMTDVTLIGHSYGGGVAILTYLNYLSEFETSRIKKLILIDSAGYEQDFPFFIGNLRIPIINKIILNVFSAEFRAKFTLKKLFFDNSKVTDEKILQYSTFFDMPGSHNSFIKSAEQILPENYKHLTSTYNRINIPTLIIWGENDSIISIKYAHKFKDDIKNSELVIIDRCGHIPHEEKPDETIKIIKDFLERQEK
jgi:pimeloyl-ACP methyl ester carboxylesterase